MPGGIDYSTPGMRTRTTRAESIKIFGVTTGTLQLKPTVC
jgi:hypothetical protein